MTTFGLDDVRDSFTSDVTRFLADIERGARAIAAMAADQTSTEAAWRAPLDAMTVGLHGIAGSSSLIGLDRLTKPARRLEELAAVATEASRQLLWHRSRVERIAALCARGAVELRGVLDHELSGDPTAASACSAAVQAEADAVARGLTAPALVGAERASTAPSPTTVRIPVLPAAARTTPTDDSWELTARTDHEVDAELRTVFVEEAREAIANLRGHLARLSTEPTTGDAAPQVARLLHLLRGAAAAAQRPELAQRAAALHALALAVQDTTTGPERGALLGELTRGVDALAVAALGIAAAAPPPPTSPPPAPPAPPVPDDDDPRAIFREEAQRVLAELRAELANVEAARATARGVAIARAERLFHRLKGSAMIVGEPAIAAIAARGQAACEPLEHAAVGPLHELARQLTREISPAEAATPPRGPVPVTLPATEEWEVYLEESTSLLDELDRMARGLERAPSPLEDLTAMFRAYHTLKGATNSVGLSPIGQQLHVIEAALERMTSTRTIPDPRGLTDVLLDEHQQLRATIARASRERAVVVDLARTQRRLAQLGERHSTTSSWIAPTDSAWLESTAEPAASSRPESGSATTGSGADGAGDSRDDHAAAAAAPERRFVRVGADRLDGMLDLVGELVVARSRILARIDKLRALQGADQARYGAAIRLVDDFASSTQFTNLDGRGAPGLRARRRPAQGTSPGFSALELDHYEEIHVLSRQLDEAANDLGELRREVGAEMARLTEDGEALSTVIAGLQTEITQARMHRLETLFARLQLPIRDAAQRAARRVDVVVTGEHVAIDKAMSDALYAPLLHLVRNAVAHGIEAEDARRAAGKPAAGTIRLSAHQDAGEVVIEVSDDGAGVDVARLRAAGVAHGALPADTPDDDPRVLELVFAPGVSTSARADDLAGRGIGGDVVRRAIERLNGAIRVSSRPGGGTTFRLSLPTSMSITQAVLLRSGGVTLAIPIAFSESILAHGEVEAVDSLGRLRLRLPTGVVPVHDTRRLFDPGATPAGGVFVVCAIGGARVAIAADEVVGQEEIVVKGLGPLLDGHPLFAGSTQRGDGDLVLILDVPGALAAESVDAPRPAPASRPASAPAPIASGATSAGADARPTPVADAAARAGERPRVLFVDDSISVRKVAERMLSGLGVDVVTAVDGLDALDKLRAGTFALVFTDLEMPRMHGYELVRELAHQPTYRGLPVVVVSSRSGQKHIDQALALGAREYLTKPFSPDSLGDVLRRWIGAARTS